jgi:hypothetical protein
LQKNKTQSVLARPYLNRTLKTLQAKVPGHTQGRKTSEQKTGQARPGATKKEKTINGRKERQSLSQHPKNPSSERKDRKVRQDGREQQKKKKLPKVADNYRNPDSDNSRATAPTASAKHSSVK